eukprot:CAMPEP_0184492680 /NCGR_PEP_ID=MMETSP0113_2-20130426/23975_1 /TAXON_ID=91329 /ORGANISM="Norrisiella sphaerica, Strain BC52" /LENGTH=71 /DNA_ID=CAMNT_0026877617 /DNA_START=5 /DNA_END=217 /DNA_ORIENTATION=-
MVIARIPPGMSRPKSEGSRTPTATKRNPEKQICHMKGVRTGASASAIRVARAVETEPRGCEKECLRTDDPD